MADFYSTLGVSESATPDEIKKAFRTLAKKYHPDRNKGDASAEARFKEISEAYETLSDPKKKEQYDMMRKYGAHAGGPTGFQGQGFDPSDFASWFGQGGQRGGGGFEFRTSGSGFENVDLNELFSQIFGARRGGSGDPFGAGFGGQSRTGSRVRKGHDVHATIKVTFFEALEGTEKTIRDKTTGKKLKIKIPAGVEDGKRIRLRGQGQPGLYGGRNGDLLITVRVMPDQQFERKGNDVYTSTTISFKDAILGTKANVKTLTKTVSLNIPAGTQPGSKLRLKGQGLAVGDSAGDLYVTINVSIPTNITDKQKHLLEEWG